MDRRTFLRGAGAAGMGSGCAVAGGERRSSPLTASEMDTFLARLDRTVEATQRGRLGTFRRDDTLTERERRRYDLLAELGRKSLGSLVVGGMVRDLPEESRNHPGVQSSLRRYQPMMDEALVGNVALLESLTDTDMAELQNELREKPERTEAIFAELDTAAKHAGTPLRRRLHMRSIVKQLLWRMTHQPPRLLVDETLGKTRRMLKHGGYRATAIRAAVRDAQAALLFDPPEPSDGEPVNETPESAIAEPEIASDEAATSLENEARLADTGDEPTSALIPEPGAESVDAALPRDLPEAPLEDRGDSEKTEDVPTVHQPWPAELDQTAPSPEETAERRLREYSAKKGREYYAKKGRTELIAGGAVGGAGVLVFGIGAGVLWGAGSLAGAFLMTLGGAALLIGLIFLIVGAVRYSKWGRPPKSER